MADDITFRIDDAQVRAAFARLEAAGADTVPVRREIGEYIVDSMKRRFVTSTGPDGQRWVQNTQATIEAYARKYAGSYTKRGKLSKKGADRVMGKRPLIGESRTLSTQLFYQLTPEGLEAGSPHPGAAMLNFGGKKSEYPHLWGDIPAREFVGLSDEDQTEILDILARHLRNALGG